MGALPACPPRGDQPGLPRPITENTAKIARFVVKMREKRPESDAFDLVREGSPMGMYDSSQAPRIAGDSPKPRKPFEFGRIRHILRLP
jgi:hypothetical protein